MVQQFFFPHLGKILAYRYFTEAQITICSICINAYYVSNSLQKIHNELET